MGEKAKPREAIQWLKNRGNALATGGEYGEKENRRGVVALAK